MTHPDLQHRWQSLTTRLQPACTQHQEDFTELVCAYDQPQRYYHNLNHLRAVLTSLDDLRDLAQRPDCIELALWYHDAVYDSQAKDNEEKSVDWLMEVAQKWNLSSEIADESRRLILLTKDHQTTSDDVDGRMLLDVDLAILGADAETYQQYAQAIRREYAWVSDEDYRQGRTAVLSRFLNREHLYLTVLMRDRLELQARKNLRNEWQRLTGS